MRNATHDEAVELLLDSISQKGGEGLPAGFMFGKPGAPHWQKNMGVEIFYRPNKLIRAALFVRKNGPSYLRYLPIGDVWSMLQNFVAENFWCLENDVYFKHFEGTYAEHVGRKAKADFAEALALSAIFDPKNKLALFPLVPLQVDSDFASEPFFLTAPASLNAARLLPQFDVQNLVPTLFPPFKDWQGRKQRPGAWLGISSPVAQASTKMKAAILGALALAPLPRYRYLFSMREIIGGFCVVDDRGITTHFDLQPHTPALMHDVVITVDDHKWLSLLAEKLTSKEKAVRRQIHALEYFYRAWEADPSERFPTLCMTLDAIFGDVSHATQAVIDGVREVLGNQLPDTRLRQLMDLRAAVIHGGAPDVYDSRKYARYYDDYEADPIHDLELVVASCLRLKIFEGALKEQPDPNAAIIAEAQAKGRVPKKFARNTILDAAMQPPSE